MYNVNLNSGMTEEVLIPEKSIIQQEIVGRSKPYFRGFKHKQKTISLTCSFMDTFSEDDIRRVCRWLCGQNYYKPLIFSDNTEKIYYALVNESVGLVHNCLSQGYLKLSFTCNDFYSYSPIYSVNYDFSSEDVNYFTFMSNGDINCYPKFTIEKIGDGDLSIDNLSNEDTEFKLTSLKNTENIVVYNGEKIIQSDQGYRYNNFNDNYFYFLYGKNTIKVTGKCKLRIDYEFMYYA